MAKSMEHRVQLFLGPKHRSGLVKFMAKEDLDKEFAALKLLNFAMYQKELIDRETYETYDFRYSRKLNDIPRKFTAGEQAAMQTSEEQSRRFSWILAHWRQYTRDQKRSYMQEARSWSGRCDNAKEILAAGEREHILINTEKGVSPTRERQ